MKVEGSHTLAAPRERVFQALTTPATVAKLLPGCETLEPAGADTFRVKMKLGLAALSGAYEGTVKMSEQRPPEHLRLGVSGRGPWGFADGGWPRPPTVKRTGPSGWRGSIGASWRSRPGE